MLKLFIMSVFLGLAAGPAAAINDSDAMSVIHQGVAGFNSGDTKSAVAMCADKTAIIDDFAPHSWPGTGACAKWYNDFQRMSKSLGISASIIVIGDPSHLEASEEFAYVVAPTSLSFQHQGNRVNEKGMLTMTLRRSSVGWRITGWVWSDQ